MRDLSWVRKQGEIVGKEKDKWRTPLPLKESIAEYLYLFETFHDRLEEADRLHPDEQYEHRVEIQRRIRKLNDLRDQS